MLELSRYVLVAGTAFWTGAVLGMLFKTLIGNKTVVYHTPASAPHPHSPPDNKQRPCINCYAATCDGSVACDESLSKLHFACDDCKGDQCQKCKTKFVTK